ncbi:hypothetical protein FJZ31_16115 [Candidatus Poribacteria bacterium]|nr:hypothetical protein [Candidatus Poribacteria bacterium]
MYQKTNSYFSEVNILKELPKEISADKFEGFLQQITEDFPIEKFPEIFVQYYKNGEKVIILGIGRSAKCAKQTIQSLEKIPSLRGKQLQLKVLRIPKTRFLLR